MLVIIAFNATICSVSCIRLLKNVSLSNDLGTTLPFTGQTHTFSCTNSSVPSFLARYCTMLSTGLWPIFCPRMYCPARRNSRRLTAVPCVGTSLNGSDFTRFSGILSSSAFIFRFTVSTTEMSSVAIDILLNSVIYLFISCTQLRYTRPYTSWAQPGHPKTICGADGLRVNLFLSLLQLYLHS